MKRYEVREYLCLKNYNIVKIVNSIEDGVAFCRDAIVKDRYEEKLHLCGCDWIHIYGCDIRNKYRSYWIKETD